MTRWALLTLPLLVGLCGCDDPEPPPPVQASATASAKTLGPDKPRETTDNQAPRANQDMMKRLRAELCAYSGYGASYALDSYRVSLGNKPPSPEHLPSFGDYGEAGEAPKGGPSAAAKRSGRLPFDRHLRACAAAARLAKGKWPELDAALDAFVPGANSAARVLSHASRYYAKEEFARDDFKAGKEAHQQILDGLKDFAGKHAAFVAAFEKWRATVEPLEKAEGREELGKLSGALVARARAVTLAALAPERDAEKLTQALGELKTTLEKLKASGPQTGLIVRHAGDLIRVVEGLGEGEISPRDRFRVASHFSDVLDADGRIARGGLRGKVPARDARKPIDRHRVHLPKK